MKMTYTTAINAGKKKLTVEFSSDQEKTLFEDYAAFVNLFEVGQCGRCGCDDIYPLVRENSGNKYYQYNCQGCGAQLSLGQNKKGGKLFVKRKTSDGKYDPKYKGWNHFHGFQNDDDPEEDEAEFTPQTKKTNGKK